MLLITALISISSLLTSVLSQQTTNCEISRHISPCHCVNDITNEKVINEIVCSDIYGKNFDWLKLVSHKLQDVLFSGEKPSEVLIEKLVIRNTSLKYIRSEVFSRIGFRKIEIIDNLELKTIDRNAFEGSIHSAEEINLNNNQNLHNYNTFKSDIWDLLSKFANLRELKLVRSSVHSIPDNAFQPINGNQNQLKHIEITHNKIDKIGDFAFAALSSEWLHLILSHNKISKISDNSLKFSKSSKQVIRSINLSNNLLTDESFGSKAFVKIGRPIGTLYLRHNQIKTINESIFGSLFDRSDKNFFRLEIESNPIECNCSLQWLVKTKYCYSKEAQSKSALVSDQISTIKCGPKKTEISLSDFSSCPEMPEKLSPSCMESTNHNAAFSYHSIHSMSNTILMLSIFMFIV